MIVEELPILKARTWRRYAENTMFKDKHEALCDFLNEWVKGSYYERKQVFLARNGESFALKHSTLNKQKIVSGLCLGNTEISFILDTLFDTSFEGSSVGFEIFKQMLNALLEQYEKPKNDTSHEPSPEALSNRMTFFDELFRPFVVRQVYTTGKTTNILCYNEIEDTDANGNTYQKRLVGEYPVESRGSYHLKVYQWLTQYAWPEDASKRLTDNLGAMELKTTIDWVMWALEQVDRDRSMWVSDHIPIISSDENEFAWGRIREFEVPEDEDVSAWDEFEKKFRFKRMVKWWRCWLAQLFDDEFATGRTFAGTIDAGNLGICVIRSPGGEGSSTLLDVIRANLGNTLCCAARLNGDQFEHSTYYGKRLAIKDDGREKRILFRGQVHSMVVGATQSIEGKGKNAKTGFLNCGVLMSTNYPLVANVNAKDQMRRLIYIVLNPATGEKTPNWKERLNAQFPAYLAKCRKSLEGLRDRGTCNPNDIFQFEPEVLSHYRSVLQPDITCTATEFLLEKGLNFGDGLETTIEGFRTVLAKVTKSVANEKLDFDNALRQIEQHPRLEINGLYVKGANIAIDAQQLRELIVGNGGREEKANDE